MIFNSTERFLAWRYLKAKREEGFISVVTTFAFLGITLGVATLIVVTAVMNGFRHEFINRIIGFNGHLAVNSNYLLYEYEKTKNEILNIEGVLNATPLIQRQVMITTRTQVIGGLAHGIKTQDLKEKKFICDEIQEGSLNDFSSENEAVIGTKLAQRLHVKIGDSITITTPELSDTGFGLVPRSKTFKIVALFEVGMSDYDGHVVFIPLQMAQKLFKLKDSVDKIEVFVKDPLKINHITNEMKKKIGEEITVLNWQNMNQAFMGAIQVQKNVLFLILTLMILVASFNIISSMVMLVRDKSKDIAILKTIGATRGFIMRIFFMSGSAIGFCGTLSGLVLGLSITLNIESIRRGLEFLLKVNLFPDEIYYLSTLPAVIEPSEVIATIITAFILSFLATLYPALRASKVDPVEILRYG